MPVEVQTDVARSPVGVAAEMDTWMHVPVLDGSYPGPTESE